MRYLLEFLVFLVFGYFVFSYFSANVEGLRGYSGYLRTGLFAIIFGRFLLLLRQSRAVRIKSLVADMSGLILGAVVVAYQTVPEFRELVQ